MRPSTLLGLNPDDPEWQWAAYQLDVAVLDAGIREENEQIKKARKNAGKKGKGGKRSAAADAQPMTPDVLQSLISKNR